MNRTSIIFLVGLLSLALSSCANATGSRRATAAKAPRVILAAVTAQPVGSMRRADLPAAPAAMRPTAVTPASKGMPVYIAPKIAVVTLAPYEDEKGRLHGPQVMYEKIEEGRMNVDALDNPELAYIPQENMVIPPGMGNPVSSPAMQRQANEEPRMPTDYIDPRDVIVTGLLGKESNKVEAERMAVAAGRRAVFDLDIGWILLPVSVAK